MEQKAEVFDRIYQDYMDEIAKINLESIKDKLGFSVEGDEAIIPFYGRPHRVSGKGIMGPDGSRPVHTVSVLLSKYIILCPDIEPWDTEWVTYKDFKDAAPYAGGFRDNAEKPIARRFGGKLDELKKAALALGGKPPDDKYSCDLAVAFQPLPKVPLLMLFYDQDEEFPAECTLLFERRVEKYLDSECIAMCGLVLPVWLEREV